ncbi:MAG: hypothetical protein ABI861_05780 [Panacibacter sp.]
MQHAFGVTASFTACSTNDTTDNKTTDSAIYQDNVIPPIGSTNTMTNTSLIDTTGKMP